MTRETHHHCQCDYCDGEDCKDLPKSTRSELTTQELVDELSKREGVDEYESNVIQSYHLEVMDSSGTPEQWLCGEGGATILVIKK